MLFGGLRGPAKPMSRRFARWSWPLMRPPGTAMGAWAFAPAIAAEDRWWPRTRAREDGRAWGWADGEGEGEDEGVGAWGCGEGEGEGDGLSWWAKGPCWTWSGRGGGSWWGLAAMAAMAATASRARLAGANANAAIARTAVGRQAAEPLLDTLDQPDRPRQRALGAAPPASTMHM